MPNNTTTIQNIYAAFGRGDVPAILEHISEDCAWEYGGSPNDVPYLQPRSGRGGAAEFFGLVGTELEFKAFDVTNVVGTERLVVALCTLELRVKKTGKTVREVDEVHLWHFDDKGRVIKFRHCLDTLQHQRANQP